MTAFIDELIGWKRLFVDAVQTRFRNRLNLIHGAGITIEATDNVTTESTDVVISSTSAGSFSWEGSWSESTPYLVGDAVSYLGSSYICTSDATGVVPTDTESWDVLASAGTSADIPTGTVRQHLEHDGSGWVSVDSLQLPTGADRTIAVASKASGTGARLSIVGQDAGSGEGGPAALVGAPSTGANGGSVYLTGGASTANVSGGRYGGGIYLTAGASNSTGGSVDIKPGTGGEYAGAVYLRSANNGIQVAVRNGSLTLGTQGSDYLGFFGDSGAIQQDVILYADTDTRLNALITALVAYKLITTTVPQQ